MLLDNHEAYVLANQRAGRRQGEVSDGQKAVVARLLPSLKLTKPGDGRVNGIVRKWTGVTGPLLPFAPRACPIHFRMCISCVGRVPSASSA